MIREASAGAPEDSHRDVMEQLARELYGPVLRWAGRWADSADEAEDIVQEAMLKLVTRFESFRGQGKVESWMYQVTRNAAMTARRKQSVRDRVEGRYGQADPEPQKEALERLAARDLTDRVVALSRKLSEKRRRAFRMVCLKGLTCAETGRRLGVAPATIRSLVCRARKEIRSSLASCELDELEEMAG